MYAKKTFSERPFSCLTDSVVLQIFILRAKIKIAMETLMCLTYYPHMPIYARCGYIGYYLFVCVFVRLWISPPRIKLAASNFTRRFIDVHGREYPIFCELCSPRSPKSDESASARATPSACEHYCRDAPRSMWT